MVFAKKELVERYVEEALKNAKIEALELDKKTKTSLINLSFSTVYSLYSFEKYKEYYEKEFTIDEIRLIKFKIENYEGKMKDMVNIAIDPENCTLGPINMYHDILLAIKNRSSGARDKGLVYKLSKNSFNINNFNAALSLFKERDIEWLKLSKCERISFRNIGSMYGVSGSLVGAHVSNVIKQMSELSNTYLTNSDDMSKCDDENKSKESEISIKVLGLNKFDTGINGALERRGIKTLRDLREFVKNYDLKDKVRGIGIKRRALIVKMLEEYDKK